MSFITLSLLASQDLGYDSYGTGRSELAFFLHKQDHFSYRLSWEIDVLTSFCMFQYAVLDGTQFVVVFFLFLEKKHPKTRRNTQKNRPP